MVMGLGEVMRWVLSAVLGAAALYLIVGFPILIFVDCRRIVRRNEDRGVSGVWGVGSVVGVLAIVAAPVLTVRERLAWAWVPIAVEVVVVVCVVAVFRVSGLSRAMREQREARRRGGDNS